MDLIRSIADKLLSPNLSSQQLMFFVFGISLVFILLIATKVLKYKFKNLNLGFIFISLWALLINITFSLDYFRLDYKFFLIILTIVVLAFAIYALKFVKAPLKEIFDISFVKYFVGFFAVLGALLCIFIFITANGSVLPAPWLTNDSIMHSIMSKGREASSAMDLNPYFNNEYPRGFHSFVYYISRLFNVETYYLLFPITAIAYAMLTFTIVDIIDDHKKIYGFKKLLLLVLVALPFLNLLSLYGLFVAQIVVIPVLLTALYNLFKAEFKIASLPFLTMLAIVFIAVANMYGVYASTVLALGIFIKALLYVNLKREKIISEIKSLKIDFKKSYLFTIVIIFILTIPAALQFKANAISSLNTKELIFAVRPDFYSAFHLTGVWFSIINIKDTPPTIYTYIFALIIGLQLFFIFKNKINSALLKSTITILILLFVFTIILKVPYASFKYLTFVIPLYILTFGINYFTVMQRYKIVSILGMMIFMIFTIYSYFAIFKNPDTLTYKYFHEIEAVNEKYLKKGSVIVFAGETRLNYFKESDDTFETIWYFPRYQNQNIDYVIVQWRGLSNDPLANQSYIDFLNSHTEIKEKIGKMSENCIEQINELTIYDLTCTDEN